ncbi:MAG: hypothetical protein COB15_16185 [Flavobacteriales bacterium]|nr:MAG: hypothetical protein COB15_16185 [Flavobacteriales bacterium]
MKHKYYIMKKILLLVIAIVLMAPVVNASHIVGGEITVKWVGPTQNDFQIQVRVFRSCQSSSAPMPSTASVRLHDAVTYATQQTWTLNNPTLTNNLPFSDPCFPVVGICVDQGIFTQNVTIPDNANGNGYFLEYQICCRNGGVTNLNDPSNEGMTFYCEIPNPADALTLNNSSPDMGDYPLNAFFCVGNPRTFQFNVTDVDGDSLVYSLVTPLDDGFMNTAPAFPYNDVIWGGGYNLANMIGGTPPLVIDQNTGIMTGSTTLIGQFVFGVLVEEYRNGVKIGEVRRDVQFQSIGGCTGGNPLTQVDTVISNNVTIQIPYNKLYCRDMVWSDPNGDTLYMELTSTIFDSGAYYTNPIPDGNGDYTYFWDWDGTSFNSNITIPPNGYDPLVGAASNVGDIGQRWCYTPSCSQIGVTYPFRMAGYSVGCDGVSGDTIDFFIEVIEPIADLKSPGNKSIPFASEYCRNIVFHDANIVDAMQIEITSEIFSMGAEFPSVDNTFGYQNWVYFGSDSILTTNVSNGAPSSINSAKRFCWTPDCEHIGNTYNIQATISSIDCPTSDGLKDTINFSYTVLPPFDSLDVIPNVFSPNGDGINDVFTLGYTNADGNRVGGTSNPCHDDIQIKIYSRWGLLVYESNEYPEFEWDGSNKGGGKVNAGTYFVLISGTYGNETVTLDQRTVSVVDPK